MRHSSTMVAWMNTWRKELDTPVDIAFLVIFRIAFGLLIALDIFWYFHHGFIATFFIQPEHTFTYLGFGWVKPLPGFGMYLLFSLVGLSGLMIATGWFYRLASIVFVTGFAYIFLIDQTLYLNHNYMIILIGLIMTILPAQCAFSLDARRRRVRSSGTAPRWTLWLLRGQIGLVYFYGGIAKLNSDWLRGEPLRMWLGARRDMPVIGPWLDTEFTVYFFSYGGLLFDLLIAPLLLFRRTRVPALVACAFFHLTNSIVFNIGIFPWLMLASTFLFFPPETVARWLPFKRSSGTLPSTRPSMCAALAVFVIFQLLMPLRHWCYPGDVAWTEEGHRFSWRMKLRSKQGWLQYRVVDPKTGRMAIVRPNDFLTSHQAGRMSCRPDMILQAAHMLVEQGEAELGHRPQVFADAFCSLNGRTPARLIDPSVNLGEQPRNLQASDWIIPLDRANVRDRARTRDVPIITPWRQVFVATTDDPDMRASVMKRLLQQEVDRIGQVNQSLESEFGITANGFYTQSGTSIYALRLKPEFGGKNIQITTEDLEQMKRYFDIHLHREILSQRELERYSHLATMKHQASQRLEMLAEIAPPESVEGLEIE